MAVNVGPRLVTRRRRHGLEHAIGAGTGGSRLESEVLTMRDQSGTFMALCDAIALPCAPTIETLGLSRLRNAAIEVDWDLAPGIRDEPDDSTSYASVRMPPRQ